MVRAPGRVGRWPVTITTADTKPRPEAVAIGKVLEAEPPFGYRDRFSEWGWAHVVEGVLRAQERVRAAAEQHGGIPKFVPVPLASGIVCSGCGAPWKDDHVCAPQDPADGAM